MTTCALLFSLVVQEAKVALTKTAVIQGAAAMVAESLLFTPLQFKLRVLFEPTVKVVVGATAEAAEAVAVWAAVAVAQAAPCVWLRQHPQPSVPIVLQSLVPVAAVQLAVLVAGRAQWDALAFTPMTCQERPAQPWFGSLINLLATKRSNLTF